MVLAARLMQRFFHDRQLWSGFSRVGEPSVWFYQREADCNGVTAAVLERNRRPDVKFDAIGRERSEFVSTAF
jgi:hypothetical protein